MDNNWFLEKANDLVTHRLHKPIGLLAGEVLFVVGSLMLYKLIPDGRLRFLYFSYGVLFLSLCGAVMWLIYVHRYPKRPKTKLGVALAICAEDPEDKNILEKDFVVPFKSKIKDLGLPFEVLVLPRHQSEWVETKEDAEKVLRKTKAHFCIWGTLKKRKGVAASDKYLFSLRGIVVHEPINEVQKVLLTKEFDSLLPNTLAIEEGLQFEAFDFRASQAVAAVDYITGRAAFLSGDLNIAIRLHEALLQAILNGQSYPINKNALRQLLSFEYDQKAAFDFAKNSISTEYEQSVKKALQYDQNNYGALLKKAILQFNGGNGDAKAALITVKQASKRAQGYHWLYSQAFLHFWLEEYSEAVKDCDKLKVKGYVGEDYTVKEVVDFNEKLLKTILKPQLYYWLGFVVYVKSANSALADQYFQKFLDGANDKMHDLKIRAESYLSATKKKIGY